MSIKRLIEQKRTMGAKIETTPYVKESAVNWYYSIYNIKIDPNILMYARKLARADLSRDLSISGKRSTTISFDFDMHPGSNVYTAPKEWDFLQACAMKQTTYGTTGVGLTTDANYDRVPMTFCYVDREEGTAPGGLAIWIAGAMGKAKFSQKKTGEPVTCSCTFEGRLDSIATLAAAAMITPSNFDTALPDATLSATINLFNTIQFIDGFDIDLGNDVQLFTDPSNATGIDGARVVGRTPVLTLAPDMLTTSNIDWYTSHINNTTGTLSVQIGRNATYSAPVCQLEESYKAGAREGHVTNPLKLGLMRSSGNDEFEILSGSKA
jgi:hypothetical protein